MKPAAFKYVAPDSIDELRSLLGEYGGDARVLAGGQSLVALMNMRMVRPAVLIDLNRCAALQYTDRHGSYVAFGAMTRQMDAMRSPTTLAHCPLVADALAHAGPVAVRNRATVGGTLAHADRVAELPAVAFALDAVLVIDSTNGTREVPAREFFLGDLTTALEPGEFLREVRFPVCEPSSFSAFREVSVRQEGVAVTGLAMHLVRNKEKIRSAALAAMAVDAVPVRLRQTEAALQDCDLREMDLDRMAQIASAEINPMSDPYASAAYRKHVVGALVKKLLASAVARQSA